jgi:hypothetical protein
MVPCVIVIRNNLVEKSQQCRDEHHAVQVFLRECRDNLASGFTTNIDDYSTEDLHAIVERGYQTFDNGSVCLTWMYTAEEVNDAV